ncbi:oxygen-dependent coproporphyrinogen oxidase [Nostoc sp. CHAB 5836]|uniref:oxygen-dependent coproporphyrinogen oxidase n=1 Tax=Nostoc sp. CHAB 5836 TaxID=2780404 RepID=UPI001E624183|nr:oxygen-dependent coproporphyrinogen oxidase [Nostoc sp. CHAB 5836]MCC5618136.1 oxygen-dependent coproporphyrinogen oxidase [Nostoc sp. CHAB 5836]
MQTTEKPKQKQKQKRKTNDMSVKISNSLHRMFDNLCKAIEEIDGCKFAEKSWNRDENGKWIEASGGNGIVYIDRALRDGNVFEKVGVNYVSMLGELPPGMSFRGSEPAMESENGSDKPTPYFATSTSFAINPKNPMAPTAHVNYRYFQLGDGVEAGSWWFGGGGDLTPIYLFEEDAVHFHRVHKEACDKHNIEFYPRFKKWCDEYFYLPHRAECRGVGGIFFDNLQGREKEELFSFVKTCSEAFNDAYLPLVNKRKDMEYLEENKYWQKLRRGRYAEFILLNDKGTSFGLKTGIVQPQSVLNCMPGEAFWNYEDYPLLNSKEAKLLEVLKNPRDWV